MSALQTAGLLATVGSVIFLVAPMFASSGLYKRSPEERVSYVRDRAASVRVQNTWLSIAGLLVAVGFVLWSVDARGVVEDWLNYTAAGVIGLSAVFLAVFFYQTTIDPASYYTAERISWVGNTYFLLASAGFVLYGFAFMQALTPDWVGWFSIGVAVLMLIGFAIIGGKDLPPQPYFLISLVSGVVFLIEVGI